MLKNNVKNYRMFKVFLSIDCVEQVKKKVHLALELFVVCSIEKIEFSSRNTQ